MLFFFLFFFKNRYRKVLLFISKAPQFRSHKTQSLNKSFNKAVQLTFFIASPDLSSSWFCDSQLKSKKKKKGVADFSRSFFFSLLLLLLFFSYD